MLNLSVHSQICTNNKIRGLVLQEYVLRMQNVNMRDAVHNSDMTKSNKQGLRGM